MSLHWAWWLGGVFFCAWLLTGALRRYALQRGVVDVPNDRSSHTSPTPRGGGVAIAVPFLASLLVWTLAGGFAPAG
ncbi:MAG: glycosyl transferase, partial [Rhodocyclaceae bacterium]